MRKVKCAECGYFYRRDQTRRIVSGKSAGLGVFNPVYDYQETQRELTPQERQQELAKYAIALRCFRHASFTQESSKIEAEENDERLVRLARKSRRCDRYFKYEPGYTPEQHLELRERNEERSSMRRYALVQMLIGSLTTIAGGLLVLLIQKLSKG